MGTHDSKPEQDQLLALMEGVEDFRKAVGAVVAALVADGFTDEQAREIIAGFWRMAGKTGEPDA